MKSSQNGKKLAIKMVIALVCGLITGFGCIALREHLLSSGQTELWTTINNVFFQDITAAVSYTHLQMNKQILLNYQ